MNDRTPEQRLDRAAWTPRGVDGGKMVPLEVALGCVAAARAEARWEPGDEFFDRLIDEIVVRLGGTRGQTSDLFPLARWDMRSCVEAALPETRNE